MDSLKNIALQIREKGISGAHDLIFLTRYAALGDDRRISASVGVTLEKMSSLPANAFLAYAYGEYYEYSKSEYCPAAADYILRQIPESVPEESPGILLMAYARCAAAFGKVEYLEKAVELAAGMSASGGVAPDLKSIAFAALGFVEMYRTTFSEEYLQAAEMFGDVLVKNFSTLFTPEDAYDLEHPGGVSAVAVLYDALAGYTGKKKWEEARSRHNVFVSKLAEKYPDSVLYGLCALLRDEFGITRVLCEVPEEANPKQLQAVLAVYSPNTYITVKKTEKGGKVRFFLLNNDEKTEICF